MPDAIILRIGQGKMQTQRILRQRLRKESIRQTRKRDPVGQAGYPDAGQTERRQKKKEKETSFFSQTRNPVFFYIMTGPPPL